MSRPRVLLTGAAGQVGQALARRLDGVDLITPARTELDLGDPAAIVRYLHQTRPDLIINPAAYTDVDKAESHSEAAMAINALAPRVLARLAQDHGIGLIHFSTDYVFDGARPEPYVETDATAPLNVYGRSKRDGEVAVLEECEAAWILRTSWIYSAHGSNFLKTVLRLAQQRKQLNIVADQWGAPTWARTIADAVAHMLGHAHERTALTSRIRQTRGLYHLTAGGATNWHDYACHIVRAMPAMGLQTPLTAADVLPIPAAAYPTAAARPRNSRLCTDKLTRTFGISLPTWEQALQECLGDFDQA
ncbi:MAG TPA: dTDP-4-dehydrorhamnose reductase [Herbaspirillum sp.]|uniref:dTDP-4-dehydrorhamnose reductase n=1 Tax=Herbaspirillum sp. TaxID=1890675 RepID=UPI002D47A85E|nr:dTDP-4-dehydrorhamnose reductase [Herbaspirillum sp.]HZG19171.1 dTDP-4-dehydrorhamnose reductase [Herbaspirillum sp.]